MRTPRGKQTTTMRALHRLFVVALLASAAAVAPQHAPAQEAATSQPASAPATRLAPEMPANASVVVFNRTVVVFRAPYLGFSPAERAALATERVRSLLDRPGPGEVTTQPAPDGVRVQLDGTLAFMVTAGDANTPNEETQQATAARAADALRQVIAETRELRDTRAMAKAAALAALTTLVYAALMWGLLRLRRLVGNRILRTTGQHAQRLQVSGVQIVERDWVLRITHRVVSGIFILVALLLTYEWVSRMLGFFPFTRPWGERLNGFLLRTATELLSGIAAAVPQLLIAAVIFLIARSITNLLDRFFDRVQSGSLDLGWVDKDTVRPTRRLLTLVVWLLALVMAYPYLPGAETEAFKGLSVLVGLMISIGGASVIGQAFSGVILIYTRTFRVGEYVRIDSHEGTVVEMTMYQTRIRTGLGEELTLPNSLVLGTVTKNYSRTVHGAGFILDTTVTIGYDTPWRQVHAMLVDAAVRTPGVLGKPSPHVFQTALSDFYVEYRLVAQAIPSEPRPRAEVLSQLHQNIQDVFNENGVQIMSPHYLGDPAEAKLVPKSRWFEPPAQRPDAHDAGGR